VVQKDNPEKLF